MLKSQNHLRRCCWSLALILLSGMALATSVGCSKATLTKPHLLLDPQARREHEIASEVKDDPFPEAGKARN